VNQDRPRDPEREAASGELRVLLESAIDRLPDGAREVFMLREVEGMSTAEVGSSLGISEDAVKTRLSRARAALRHDLMERTRSSAPQAFRFYRPRCDRVVACVLERIAGT
jgi:RNA polymerase sigma-70 factor, ECF subfamily